MRWSILLLSILFLHTVSAISTNLSPFYQPGETIIIKIEGNILEPISASNIIFKRNHVAVAVNYNVNRIGENYYLYAQAPLNKNNYTLFINDISTTVNGIVTSIDFNQSFKIDGNITDYSLSPGFAITKRENIDITINLNLDQSISITTDFPDEHSINLNPGANTISLSIANKPAGVYYINMGKYQQIPIQIISNPDSQNQTSSTQLTIFPSVINRIILSNTNYSFNISLLNNGSSSLQNLQFSFNENIFKINSQNISLINYQEEKEIKISLLKKEGNSINENIIIYNSNQQLAVLKINISFTSDSNKTYLFNETAINSNYYCLELSGIFCTTNEICSSDPIQAIDGSCCTGTCTIEEKSSYGWIGYLSIVIILAVLIFMYIRYKKTALPKSKVSASLGLSPPRPNPIQQH